MNSQEPRPLRALIVSGDRPLLRHISQFLSAFEYEVWQAEGKDGGLALCEAVEPEFVLLDASRTTTEQLDACRASKARCRHTVPFIFWLSAPLAALEMIEVLEAGADDFLAKPLVYGEALARLRAGARLLEHRRRARGQNRLDPETGVLSAAAFNRAAFVRHHLRKPPRRRRLRDGRHRRLRPLRESASAEDRVEELLREFVAQARRSRDGRRSGRPLRRQSLRLLAASKDRAGSGHVRRETASDDRGRRSSNAAASRSTSRSVAASPRPPMNRRKTFERLETALRGAKASGTKLCRPVRTIRRRNPLVEHACPARQVAGNHDRTAHHDAVRVHVECRRHRAPAKQLPGARACRRTSRGRWPRQAAGRRAGRKALQRPHAGPGRRAIW